MNTFRIVILIMGITFFYTVNMLPEAFAAHNFSAFTTPTGTVGITKNYSITIANTNATQPPDKLGSLTIGIHPNFIDLGVPVIISPPSRPWTCSLTDSTISCRANNFEAKLRGKEMLSVSISATPTSEGMFEWSVTTFHDRKFANEISIKGSQPRVTIYSGAMLPLDAPNIIVIISDDQRWDTIDFMPTVKNKLAEQGIKFTNSFVTTPLCCPSRASFLTGQYVHNHGVLTNKPPEGGALKFDDASTIATWLKGAGYSTSFVGKYLNGYADMSPYIPAGWDDWHVFRSPGYYSYTLNENLIHYTFGTSEGDYSTDVLKDRALEFIRNAKQPFFLLFAPFAPHVSDTLFPLPAPRHVGKCGSLDPHRPPNFNEVDVSDKPSWVNELPLLKKSGIKEVDKLRKNQICSLKAVDEAIDSIVNEAETDNTVIIFTSDNGFLLGEHRIKQGKQCIYEECARVPLIIKYPKLISGPRESDKLVLNIDLAPTIAELSGAIPNIQVDGKSLMPILSDLDNEWRSDILLEYYFRTGPYTSAVRSMQFKYVELGTGERELYDLTNDPYELNNIVNDPAYFSIIEQLEERLAQLKQSD
jgi:arylsulfatase A-like enzyme